MVNSLRRLLKLLKLASYALLSLMIYWTLIGPEGVAEFLKVEEPSEEGLGTVGILIPKHVLYWTFGTVVLEAIDNLFSYFKFTKFDDEPITRGEFREEMSRVHLGKSETSIRIAKIEAELKKLKE